MGKCDGFLVALMTISSIFYADISLGSDPEFKPILDKWALGRCHMGQCDWHKMTTAEIVGKREDGLGVLLIAHLESRFDLHDDLNYETKPDSVEYEQGFLYVFCSKSHPGLPYRRDDEDWRFAPLKPGRSDAVFGYNKSSYRLYYAACHHTTEDVSDELAAKLGYNFQNGDLADERIISGPFGVLTLQFD